MAFETTGKDNSIAYETLAVTSVINIYLFIFDQKKLKMKRKHVKLQIETFSGM